MLKSGTAQISEIDSVSIYSLENERRWPAYNELNAKSLFWETNKKSDIEKCIVKLRTHSEGSAQSKKSSNAYVVKIKLKDRRIGLIKIIEYPNILYVIPYPKKSEFGVHGFFNNAFFDILKENGGERKNGVTP